MKKEKSIIMNFFMNGFLSIATLIFPLITFPYASRVLNPSGIGAVSYVTSVISYFLMFSQLGIPTYGIRVCAQVRDDKEKLSKTVHELLLINIVTSIISYVILFLVTNTVPQLSNDKELVYIISITIALSAIGVEWLYKGLEEYTYITVRSIVFKAIALVALFLFVHTEDDYVVYGAISIFAASASNVCNFINARKYISFGYQRDYNFKRHLRPILIFFGMSCATTIYTNLDTVMLGTMCNNQTVGLYNAAIKIKSILVCLITSLGAVLLPRASYYIKNGNKTGFVEILNKALLFVTWASIPVCVYFMFYAKECILFLAGEKYLESIPIMQALMPTIVFIGFSNIIGMQVLVPYGKEKYVFYSEVAGAMTDFFINILLIPKIGALGAAIGTLVAEAIVLLIQIFLVSRVQRLSFDFKYLIKIIVISIIVIIVTIPVKNFQCNLFFTLTISLVGFAVVFLGILLLTRDRMTTYIVKKLKGIKGAE